MASPILPDTLMAAVRDAPQTGVPLLMALLEEKRIKPSERLSNGDTLAQAVLEAFQKVHDQAHHALVKALMTTDMAQVDRLLGDGQVLFATRLSAQSGGALVPVQMLAYLRGKKRNEQLPGVGRGQLDAWFAHALGAANLTSKERAQALAGALAMDLNATVDVLWRLEAAADVDEHGRTVLLSARQARTWQRFLAAGGDPGVPVHDLKGSGSHVFPLWLAVARQAAAASASSSAESFPGAVERWLWQHAAALGRAGQDALEKGLAARAAKPWTLEIDEWAALLQGAAGVVPDSALRSAIAQAGRFNPLVPLALLQDPRLEGVARQAGEAVALRALALYGAGVCRATALNKETTVPGADRGVGAVALVHALGKALQVPADQAAEVALILAVEHPLWPQVGSNVAELVLDVPLVKGARDRLAGLMTPEVFWGCELGGIAQTTALRCYLQRAFSLAVGKPGDRASVRQNLAVARNHLRRQADKPALVEAMDAALAVVQGEDNAPQALLEQWLTLRAKLPKADTDLFQTRLDELHRIVRGPERDRLATLKAGLALEETLAQPAPAGRERPRM